MAARDQKLTMPQTTIVGNANNNANTNASNVSHTRLGIRGVRLKAFEEVVADLLPIVRPSFLKLPPLPTSCDKNWPFKELPASARVSGTSPGQLSGNRALRKEGQLRSLLRCIVAMLPEKIDVKKRITIVDFCGGTGWLSIPISLLRPDCDVVIVDLKAASLNFVHKKAIECLPPTSGHEKVIDTKIENVYDTRKDVTHHDLMKRQCCGIPNLYTFHGSIESYNEDFQMGCALHACGEASDIVLRKCGAANASFVISPCCVGKLSRQNHNPYIYHATAGNEPTIAYPQSKTFSKLLTPTQWDTLVKAADYSAISELRSPSNAARRTAKALLETDRILYMQNHFGSKACLTRMEPWESSPKNDILLGWFEDSNKAIGSPYQRSSSETCLECITDVQMSEEHLLGSGAAEYCQEVKGDSVDWTRQEEEDTRRALQLFIQSDEREMLFPTGQGRKRRKLIHYVAEQRGIIHRSHGKKDSQKTVLVRKR